MELLTIKFKNLKKKIAQFKPRSRTLYDYDIINLLKSISGKEIKANDLIIYRCKLILSDKYEIDVHGGYHLFEGKDFKVIHPSLSVKDSLKI